MLPETDYLVIIDEDGKKTSFVIRGEDVTDWVETNAVQIYTKNKLAQFYNKSGTNSKPLHGVAYYLDKSCGCTKTLTANLIIEIEEITDE